jgi:hypothetical protein
MSIAGPNRSMACATFPSGPGRRTPSTAPNVWPTEIELSLDIAETSLGMIAEAPAGTPLYSVVTRPPGVMMTHRSPSGLVEMGTCDSDVLVELHVVWGRSLTSEKTLNGQA